MGVASLIAVWMKVDVTYTTLGCVFFHSWDKKHPRAWWSGKAEGLWAPGHMGTPYGPSCLDLLF